MVYERQIATATRLIRQKGQLCTWREPGVPGGTPSKPTAGTPADHAVHIVFLNNTNREYLAAFLSMLKDTEIPTGGLRGLMAATSFTPTLKGQVTRAATYTGPVLTLDNRNGIDKLDLNGELILYYLRFVR
jgi:hypothetical protein